MSLPAPLAPAPVAASLEPPPAPPTSARPALLPAGYGTGRLLLTARDSRWLYAHWDLSAAQRADCGGSSASGRFVLRVHRNNLETPPVQSIDLHSDSTHWFVPVDQAGSRYVGELGFHTRAGDWRRVAISEAACTPPESVSEERAVRFTTIPQDVPLPELFARSPEPPREAVPARDSPPPLQKTAPVEPREHFPPPRVLVSTSASAPPPASSATVEWTQAHDQALARVTSLAPSRRVWMGSLEIAGLLRKQPAEEASSPSLPLPPALRAMRPTGLESIAPSSPIGGETPHPPRGFWFNINAELVVYGATEPDARVDIGGRKVKLRPDGTFSFRFILPDGHYELPVIARSADGMATRQARLQFQRETEYRGAVGAHPPEPGLRDPRPEHTA